MYTGCKYDVATSKARVKAADLWLDIASPRMDVRSVNSHVTARRTDQNRKHLDVRLTFLFRASKQ